MASFVYLWLLPIHHYLPFRTAHSKFSPSMLGDGRILEGMMDLVASERPVRSDIRCLLAFLGDTIDNEENWNDSKQEPKELVRRLKYLIVMQG